MLSGTSPCPDQIVAAMQRIYAMGLTTTSGGNVSMIDREGRIFITPGGIDKGTLTPNAIVEMAPDGTYNGRYPPSSEYPFHQGIYAARPDLRAIVHAHPPGIVAMTAARAKPRTELVRHVAQLVGNTVYAPYALVGSQELGRNMAEAFARGGNVVLLENHGLAVGGADMLSAFLLLEILEHHVLSEIHARNLPGGLPERGPTFSAASDSPLPLEAASPLKIDDAETIQPLIARAYNRRLISGHFGVFSRRIGPDAFMITPADKDRAGLCEHDMIMIAEGHCDPTRRPDPLWRLHRRIYRDRPEIGGLINAAPPHAMAFAMTGTPFDTHIIPEGFMLLKEVVGIDTADEDLIAATLSRAVPALLVKHHYAMVAGSSLPRAFDRLEVLEFGAASLLMARVFDRIYRIDDEAIRQIDQHFNLW